MTYLLDIVDAEEIGILDLVETESSIDVVSSETTLNVSFSGDQILEVIELFGPEGPVGPEGPTGPQGPQGDEGPVVIQAFVFDQGAPLDLWTVVHNLGFYPSVTIVDSAGSQVEGHVVYNSINDLTISFTLPFGGKAFLS